MDFGQPVKVSRQVVRVLVDQQQIFEDIPQNIVGAFIPQRSLGYAPLYRAVIGYTKRARYEHPLHSEAEGWKEWPGIGIDEADAPLPLRKGLAPIDRKPYDLEPARMGYVRFRRIDRPLTSGILVGNIFLLEGHVTPGSSGGWDGEPEPPYFSQQRRVPLLEIAVKTEGKARLMLCWRDDVSCE